MSSHTLLGLRGVIVAFGLLVLGAWLVVLAHVVGYFRHGSTGSSVIVALLLAGAGVLSFYRAGREQHDG